MARWICPKQYADCQFWNIRINTLLTPDLRAMGAPFLAEGGFRAESRPAEA
jgi:hypothetical protein